MCDLASVAVVRFLLAWNHDQPAAGHVLVVALFGGPGGLHVLGDNSCLPGHYHGSWIEVSY